VSNLKETLNCKKKALAYIEVNGKLPVAFKANWLRDLRSGKYKQGRGKLIESHFNGTGSVPIGYCCLGVACKTQGLSDTIIETAAVIEAPAILAAKNRKKGIPEIIQGTNPVTDFLTHSNDVRKLSFKQIADWIEKYL
jgi:hypothetical protein